MLKGGITMPESTKLIIDIIDILPPVDDDLDKYVDELVESYYPSKTEPEKEDSHV